MVAHGDVGILRIIYNLELRIVLRISDNCVVKCAFDVDCDTVALLDGVFDRNEDLDDDVVLKLKAMEGIIVDVDGVAGNCAVFKDQRMAEYSQRHAQQDRCCAHIVPSDDAQNIFATTSRG